MRLGYYSHLLFAGRLPVVERFWDLSLKKPQRCSLGFDPIPFPFPFDWSFWWPSRQRGNRHRSMSQVDIVLTSCSAESRTNVFLCIWKLRERNFRADPSFSCRDVVSNCDNDPFMFAVSDLRNIDLKNRLKPHRLGYE